MIKYLFNNKYFSKLKSLNEKISKKIFIDSCIFNFIILVLKSVQIY